MRRESVYQPTLASLLLVFGILSGCTVAPHTTDSAKPILSNFRIYPLEGMDVIYNRVEADKGLSEGEHVAKGQKLGRIAPLPDPESKEFQTDLDKSRQLYARQEYEEAVNTLAYAMQLEPGNPFMLEARARAYYHFDRDASYADYRALINYLDSVQPGSLVIDLWFTEAYFKLATLELDRHDYGHAAIDLSRALEAMQVRNEFDYQLAHNRAMIEQIFQYLTESYYEQHNADKSGYYAALTLQVNPTNVYALCASQNKPGC